MKELTFPMVGSVRVNAMRTRRFTGTQEVYPKEGVVHAHSCLLNGTFTSRDGEVTGVYASVFIPLEQYNAALAEKSTASVVEVRCVVKSIEDRTSSAGKAYREAKVDEEGPKKVICTPIEDEDDYFGGETFPIMAKRAANTGASIKV